MSVRITNSITIDVALTNTFNAVIGKQYDKGSRALKCSFTNNGVAMTIDTGSTATIKCKMPDGTTTSGTATVNSDGTVTAVIPDRALEQVGMVSLSISIVDTSNQQLTSTTFYLNVQEAESKNGEILMYVAPSSKAAGTYYITVGSTNYQFTTVTTIPQGGKIYFLADMSKANTYNASGTALDTNLTITNGTSGTQLAYSEDIALLIALEAQIATHSQQIATKADKDTDAVSGNLCKFDSDGDPVDSGVNYADPLLESNDIATRLKTDTNTGFVLAGNASQTLQKMLENIVADVGTPMLSTVSTLPASSSAEGKAGDIYLSTDYLYVCVATNTWRRVAISTF